MTTVKFKIRSYEIYAEYESTHNHAETRIQITNPSRVFDAINLSMSEDGEVPHKLTKADLKEKVINIILDSISN